MNRDRDRLDIILHNRFERLIYVKYEFSYL